MAKPREKSNKDGQRLRKSPRAPAEQHKGQALKGMNGQMWMSLFSPTQGYYRWLPLKKRSGGISFGGALPKKQKDSGRRARAKDKLFLVELFAGTHSVSEAVKRSSIARQFDVRILSVDIEPRFQPTVAADINTWRFKETLNAFLLQKLPSDLVAVHASPPCTEFSRALTTRCRDLQKGSENVKSALRIIKFVQPDIWFIENPVGLLKDQPFMQKYNKYLNTTTYCKYGTPYKKPTNIWTNVRDLELPVCNSQSPCRAKLLLGRHVATAQAGPTSTGHEKGGGAENVYHLPPRLVRYVFQRGIEQSQIA